MHGGDAQLCQHEQNTPGSYQHAFILCNYYVSSVLTFRKTSINHEIKNHELLKMQYLLAKILMRTPLHNANNDL